MSYDLAMRGMSWGLVGCLLLACGGRSVTDNPGAGGAAAEGGGGSVSFSGAGAGGGSPTGGMSSTGGASGGASAGSSGEECRNERPALPVVFSFESNSNLWIRRTCSLEYSIGNVCLPKREPIQTETFCSQECGVQNDGCVSCGACSESAVQVGANPSDAASVLGAWDGYAYTLGTSSLGCTCHYREPVRSGSYDVTVVGYLSYEDARAQKNAFPFTTPFHYPPPDGTVHVRMDFIGL
ncbi:MAG: hypothetical protein ABJB12_19885 [Pseudomonadota bacterium]